MKGLYRKIEEAEILIFGTPNYWYGPTAQMKLLIDRLRPFIANRKLAGKKGVLICPSEEGAVACEPLVQMFLMAFSYLGMEDEGQTSPFRNARELWHILSRAPGSCETEDPEGSDLTTPERPG